MLREQRGHHGELETRQLGALLVVASVKTAKAGPGQLGDGGVTRAKGRAERHQGRVIGGRGSVKAPWLMVGGGVC